jgi:hypothetical protein
MRTVQHAAFAVMLACVAFEAPAYAQFTLAVPPRARIETGGGANRVTSVLFYPVAPFVINDPLGVGTFNGVLLSVEHAVIPKNQKAFAVGGWFWTDRVRDLYEVHAKYYFKGDLGVQAGIVGSTNTGEFQYDAFLIYNLTPALTERNYWNFQVGAGLFVDPNFRNKADEFSQFSRKSTVTDFTGFIQGDTTLRKNLKLTMSYWYVGAGARLNRFAIGVGQTF